MIYLLSTAEFISLPKETFSKFDTEKEDIR